MEEIKSKAPSAAEGSALRELADDPSSRKRFLKMVGGTGAASAFAVFLAACGGDEGTTTTSGGGSTGTTTTGGAASKGDLEIVNYALTLEYLEADFYRQVIDSGEIKDQAIADLAQTFGEHEQEHVDALKATVEQMGGTPAEVPQTDFEKVLKGGPKVILETAASVENLGAAAYLGQAGNIKSPEILAAALSIHTVEARHAAALNQAAGNDFQGAGPLNGSIPDGPFAEPMDMDAVLKEVQPFLAKS